MKKFRKTMGVSIAVILILWTMLTLWVEMTSDAKTWKMGNTTSSQKALVVFDADPFYNLDEQVSKSFAEGLSETGQHVTVATVAAAEKIGTEDFELFVFCANTYNWRPDWAVSRFIKKHSELNGKNVVAITLGAGSTKASQRNFEKIILKKETNLIDSRTYWLMRPNDESRGDESNVEIANDMVKKWAMEIGKGQYSGR